MGHVTSPVEIEITEPLTIENTELGIEEPWAVIVWDDPINLMHYVTYVFKKIFGFPDAKANKLMLDVHEKGRASVFTGDKLEAEKYVYKLHGFGLWATLEQNK